MPDEPLPPSEEPAEAADVADAEAELAAEEDRDAPIPLTELLEAVRLLDAPELVEAAADCELLAAGLELAINDMEDEVSTEDPPPLDVELLPGLVTGSHRPWALQVEPVGQASGFSVLHSLILHALKLPHSRDPRTRM